MLHILPNTKATGSGDVNTESDDVTAVLDDVTSISFMLSLQDIWSQAVILYTNCGNKIALYTNYGKFCLHQQ